MKSFKSRKLKNGQSGQGATEYILLLVVVVAVVLLFKKNIQSALEGKMTELQTSISSFGQN